MRPDPAAETPTAHGFLSTVDIERISVGFGLGQVSGCQFLPAGLMNRNWRCDTERGAVAVKELVDASGGDARTNLAVMRHLAGRGLPVCEPLTTPDGDHVLVVGGSAYCAVPWVDGWQPHGLDLDLDQADRLGATLAELHVGLDSVGAPLLPAPEIRPRARVADPSVALRDADWFLAAATAGSEDRDFDAMVAGFLRARMVLLGRFADQRPASAQPVGPFGWTHGDFQHLNVLWAANDVAAVLDWDRVRVRMRGEELARSATLLFGRPDGSLELGRIASFVTGYRRVVDLSLDAVADAVDRLWWKRMCDFWHLEFHYERGDDSCDHLFAQSCRLLDWWAGHRDDVTAAFATGA